MQRFDLTDDFIDPVAERALMAAVAQQPDLYWEVLDLVPSGAFAVEAGAWATIATAIEAEQPPLVPAGWTPAADPEAVARHLVDLWQRRLLAEAQERLAHALYDRSQPAAALATLLEEEMIRIQAAQRETQATRLMWASELLPRMLQEAEERWRVRQETGRPVRGLRTSLNRLDDLLGGWQPGLHFLAGPPGVGKTTLALQGADVAAVEVPVLYITFESSALNLIVKAIAAQAGVSP
jgi:replicative DNA helicase